MVTVVVTRSTTARALFAALILIVVTVLGGAPALAQETDPAEPGTSGETVATPGDESGEAAAADDDSGVGGALTGAAACAASAINPGLGAGIDLGADILGIDVPGCGDAATGVLGAAADTVGDVATEAAGGAVEKAALAFGNAGVAILKFALGWWIPVKTLDADTFETTVGKINDYTFYIQLAAFGLSLILLGGRLALARSGAIRDVSEDGLKQMARATVISGALTGLIVIGTRLSDNISSWFLNGTVGADPSGLVEAMITITQFGGSAGMALLFVIGIIGILGGLMMAFLMLLRTGFLVMMTVALPIAGAAGGTKVGSQAFDKMLSWTIAWLLVKPVGAFVIGCAAILFVEATPTISDPENGDGLMALSGVILLCAAALVLPSLMRLIVPNVGALGGGGSGAATAAGIAGAVAMGAKLAATGGASAGADAAQSTSGGFTPPTGASGNQSAPASFGTGGEGSGGGQQPGGNATGSPGGGNSTGGPDGNSSGTPGSSSGAALVAAGVAGAVATGADPKFDDGGFER